jgi:hypothetical protein
VFKAADLAIEGIHHRCLLGVLLAPLGGLDALEVAISSIAAAWSLDNAQELIGTAMQRPLQARARPRRRPTPPASPISPNL